MPYNTNKLVSNSCVPKFNLNAQARLRQVIFFAILASSTNTKANNDLPSGGTAASNTVTIHTVDNKIMNIHQLSDTAIINWKNFSIADGTRVDFLQPSEKAATLNRVTGQEISNIAGTINANGHVYIVNPNGITITPTGNINAAAFVAAQHDISDHDFHNRKLNFILNQTEKANSTHFGIHNFGNINIRKGGYAALLGATVENAGMISVPYGRVALASAKHITLNVNSDHMLQVNIPIDETIDKSALVSQTASGKILAHNGHIEINALALKEAVRQSINIAGMVEVSDNDHSSSPVINIDGNTGKVSVNANLVASSQPNGFASIYIQGREVGLQNAKVSITDNSHLQQSGLLKILSLDNELNKNTVSSSSLNQLSKITIDKHSDISIVSNDVSNKGQIDIKSIDQINFHGKVQIAGANPTNAGRLFTQAKHVNLRDASVYMENSLASSKSKPGKWQITAENFNLDDNNAPAIAQALEHVDVTVTSLRTNKDETNHLKMIDRDIVVNMPVQWHSSHHLKLDNSDGAIIIKAPLTVAGAGSVEFNAKGNANFPSGIQFDKPLQFVGNPNQGQSLTINGLPQKLVYSYAGLQKAAGQEKYIAIAKSINASQEDISKPEISLGHSKVAGLGNTLSGLRPEPVDKNINLNEFKPEEGANQLNIYTPLVKSYEIGAIENLNLIVDAQNNDDASFTNNFNFPSWNYANNLAKKAGLPIFSIGNINFEPLSYVIPAAVTVGTIALTRYLNRELNIPAGAPIAAALLNPIPARDRAEPIVNAPPQAGNPLAFDPNLMAENVAPSVLNIVQPELIVAHAQPSLNQITNSSHLTSTEMMVAHLAEEFSNSFAELIANSHVNHRNTSEMPNLSVDRSSSSLVNGPSSSNTNAILPINTSPIANALISQTESISNPNEFIISSLGLSNQANQIASTSSAPGTPAQNESTHTIDLSRNSPDNSSDVSYFEGSTDARENGTQKLLSQSSFFRLSDDSDQASPIVNHPLLDSNKPETSDQDSYTTPEDQQTSSTNSSHFFTSANAASAMDLLAEESSTRQPAHSGAVVNVGDNNQPGIDTEAHSILHDFTINNNDSYLSDRDDPLPTSLQDNTTAVSNVLSDSPIKAKNSSISPITPRQLLSPSRVLIHQPVTHEKRSRVTPTDNHTHSNFPFLSADNSNSNELTPTRRRASRFTDLTQTDDRNVQRSLFQDEVSSNHLVDNSEIAHSPDRLIVATISPLLTADIEAQPETLVPNSAQIPIESSPTSIAERNYAEASALSIPQSPTQVDHYIHTVASTNVNTDRLTFSNPSLNVTTHSEVPSLTSVLEPVSPIIGSDNLILDNQPLDILLDKDNVSDGHPQTSVITQNNLEQKLTSSNEAQDLTELSHSNELVSLTINDTALPGNPSASSSFSSQTLSGSNVSDSADVLNSSVEKQNDNHIIAPDSIFDSISVLVPTEPTENNHADADLIQSYPNDTPSLGNSPDSSSDTSQTSVDSNVSDAADVQNSSVEKQNDDNHIIAPDSVPDSIFDSISVLVPAEPTENNHADADSMQDFPFVIEQNNSPSQSGEQQLPDSVTSDNHATTTQQTHSHRRLLLIDQPLLAVEVLNAYLRAHRLAANSESYLSAPNNLQLAMERTAHLRHFGILTRHGWALPLALRDHRVGLQNLVNPTLNIDAFNTHQTPAAISDRSSTSNRLPTLGIPLRPTINLPSVTHEPSINDLD